MERETREFNGVRYYRYPQAPRKSDRLYFKRAGVYLHRVIWEHAHGPLSEGYQVHHIDGDTGNNDLANLAAVPAAEHIATYHVGGTQTEQRRAHIARIRPLASAWHRSAEGREWHREHARTLQQRTYPPQTLRCQHCGKEYQKTRKGGRPQFCSGACKAAARRASGVDLVTFICACCGQPFERDKNIPRRFCSRSCVNRARYGHCASL